MTNERELFLSALEIDDPQARQAHLESACAGDLGLLARVTSLLASHEGDSRFLNIPVVQQIADEAAEGPDGTIVLGINPTSDAAELPSEAGPSTPRDHDELDNEMPLDYLQPSSRPDSMGRLSHYEVLEVLGRGAFGTVLKAFDEKLQRVVAIKCWRRSWRRPRRPASDSCAKPGTRPRSVTRTWSASMRSMTIRFRIL